jgi:hypothetical protein
VLFFTMAILSFVTPYLEVSLSHAILLWQTICRHLVVLRPETVPGRLTISAARTNMVRLIRRTVRPQRIPSGRKCVLARLGWAGVIGYASGVFESAASHLPASPFLATKDSWDRFLAGVEPPGSGSISCALLSVSIESGIP